MDAKERGKRASCKLAAPSMQAREVQVASLLSRTITIASRFHIPRSRLSFVKIDVGIEDVQYDRCPPFGSSVSLQ